MRRDALDVILVAGALIARAVRMTRRSLEDTRRRCVLLAVIVALVLSLRTVRAQNAGALAPPADTILITQVDVRLDPAPPSRALAEDLTSKVRRTFRQFPGTRASAAELAFGVGRVERLPEVEAARYDVEFSGEGTRVVLHVKLAARPGAPRRPTGVLVDNRPLTSPVLYRDDDTFLKLDTSGAIAATVTKNTWFGNGAFFTARSPYGRDPPGSEVAPTVDFVLSVGGAGARRLSVDGSLSRFWIYGELLDMTVLSVGKELYRSDTRAHNHIERAFAGLVGGGSTASGHLWVVNASAGLSPYCIGGGMLICQIAGNGGEWGGANAWPRFAASLLALGQFRWDNLRTDVFYMDPHEYFESESRTRLVGTNIEYDRGFGFSAGATYVHAPISEFPYVTPETFRTREGLHAVGARAGYVPIPRSSGPIARLEGGLQTNDRFPMLAYAVAVQGGWTFARGPWAPELTYRYSTMSGDDPTTPKFERWDLLYSGGDVDTWVHGILFKNVLFNSNLQTHRFQWRMSPSPSWRVTAQAMTFVANERNNLPLAIGQFASTHLGQEGLVMVEHFPLTGVYLRAITSALFPGSGLRAALPERVASPWLSAQLILKVDF